MIIILIETIKRNHRISMRAFPWSFIFGRFVGGAYTALFSYFVYYYMFNGSVSNQFKSYIGSSDYMTYSILGASFYVFSIAVLMNVGRSLMNEHRNGTLETLLLSPVSRKGYLVGNLLEQVGTSFLEMGTIIIIGWILGAQYSYIHIDQLILVWIISLISLFSMSVCLASVMLYLRDTYITQNTLFLIINLICGISFPIQYLPKCIQFLSNLIPLTGNLTLFRNIVMNGKSVLNNLGLFMQVFLLSIIYLFIGFYWIQKSEKKYTENVFS
ncbi:ABC transporter permease [Clostridium beijerinckii]|uniref:ABC transporter permease n=1 Tax=Clostridium TaxID=1485 RepID=UPI000B3FD216|nr:MULTISPECIES: ABC transporter permease [Clostridium]NOW07502.1 ABC-2 type transport system permease protein [Clostridium beijerinckii]NYC04725.1 ABC-2 type transport system permease protein [Clostridium beijerinckii]OVE67256.1 hypothetical protein CCS79_14100 [Clostridium diolis]UYZ35672.1 ABC transporter permease [Clostridium beijerinckii]